MISLFFKHQMIKVHPCKIETKGSYTIMASMSDALGLPQKNYFLQYAQKWYHPEQTTPWSHPL